MPELPQMQALAERLDAVLGGATLEGVEPLGFSALKTVVPAPESLIGHTVERVGRRAKYLILEFAAPGGKPSGRLLIHLSQAGRLDLEDPPKRTRAKGSVVRLRFTDRPAVLVREYGHERKAAWWVLAPGDDGPLAKLGRSRTPTSSPSSCCAATIAVGCTPCCATNARCRAWGGYADDALWRAQLSPYARSHHSTTMRARLLESVRAVMRDGLERERTRTGGLSQPKLGEHFEVHARYGTPCPRCGEILRRVSYESHEVAYCPQCQTAGKVLADRRMSRLVK